jgi:hypothetical protein
LSAVPAVPRLAYIASIGRSGSTLLELLLAAHPAVATIGELHLWPHELRATSRTLPCGCGLEILDCPFWIEMRRRVDPLAAPEPRLDHFRERHDGGRTLRLARLRDFRARRGGADADMRRYGEGTAAVITAFADLVAESGAPRPAVVVDASKDPYRLAWLARSGRVDLSVLHIARDPRGFVYSESKNGEYAGTSLVRLAVRKAGAWTVANELSRRAARLPGVRDHHLVRYEDLVSRPAEVVAALVESLGLPPDPAMVDSFRDRAFHAIGGNPMRHDDRPIRLDEQWRAALPRGVQRLVQALTAPARKRFGY